MSDFPMTGKIGEDGLHPRLSDYIQAIKYFCLCRKGKLVELPEPKKLSPIRSNQANRYYWGLLGLLAKYTGYSKDEFHDMFRGLYFFTMLVINGKEEKTLRSTSTAESGEMYDYIEKIRTYQQENLPDCYLPTPAEWKRWEEDGIQLVEAIP